MPVKPAITWIKYFEQLTRKKINPDHLTVQNIDSIINANQHTFNILNHSVPMIYLLDYTTGRYMFVSRQCDTHLNFSYTKMIEGGVDFVLDNYHPQDLKLFNGQIFPDRLKMLEDIPPDQHKDHIFSFNYRIKNGKGQYVNLLQRNSFIQSDENGLPLLSLGVVTNINHFKIENPVIQLVEKVDSATGKVEAVSKSTYYFEDDFRMFSKREMEVLRYLTEGWTSKQIATKLFISEYTVINHKRNLHHKSNTQNTASLISFAFRHHLL